MRADSTTTKEEEEEEKDEKADIKSNNPHLTGGEKIAFFEEPDAFWGRRCANTFLRFYFQSSFPCRSATADNNNNNKHSKSHFVEELHGCGG